ncbi:transmembrane protein 263-like [Littorina saxatilis]|uniref:Uncharacterized protein n=1 Tax=Littorina saxatilis TaxID=31220 RepID=A0AAN9G8F8_9CAEN
MAKIYDTLKSCIYKGPGPEPVEVITNANDITEADSQSSLSPSSSSSSFYSNKKTDDTIDPSKQPGILWRVTSGVYSTATGAVGAGIGGVRWVAGKTYDVGSAVAGKTYDVGSAVAGKTYDVGSAVVSKVPVPSLSLSKKKDKNE